MARILVTGATGFIGQHCLPLLLARGHEVHAIAGQTVVPTRPGCQGYQVDLLDHAAVSEVLATVRPTHLLHLAWIATPGIYPTSPENLRWVQAGLHLLQAFASNGGQRAVLAGTCAEYDWRYGYCVEGLTPLAPVSPYGTAKHAFQQLASSYATTVGLSLAWGRIFFLYGPGEAPSRLVPSVIRSLLRGEPARCTGHRLVRDYLHVTDVADALTTVLDSAHTGPINIASGEPVTVQDVARRLAATIGHESLLECDPALGAREEPFIVGDVRQLQRELGWSPRLPLTEGLAETVHWWRQHLTGVPS